MKSLLALPTSKHTLALLVTPFISTLAHAELIAGVDFEGEAQTIFDRNPDDLNPDDEITVSSGSDGGANLFDGWTFSRTNGAFIGNGLLRNDGGANAAGATTPDFPARLEGNTNGSWSIFIPEGVTLNLEKIEFDVRGATGGTGRAGQFRTSLDPEDAILWENPDLPGRETGDWQRIEVDLTGPLYQALMDQEVAFIWTTPGGAIDLDTIEVYGSTGAGDGGLQLSLTASADTPGAFDFEWTSNEGRTYDLVSSTNLSDPIETWEVFGEFSDIAPTGEATTLEGVPVADAKRFFAIVEK